VASRQEELEALFAGKPLSGASREAYLEWLLLLVSDPKNVVKAGMLRLSVVRKRMPLRSDATVARIEANGGAVLAKSNTPEWGAGGVTFNEVFGITRNPWNPARTPGGSSGGSAVAVATGCVAIGQGTDMGGSVRIPASCTGLVGIKCAANVAA
jgi:amidase